MPTVGSQPAPTSTASGAPSGLVRRFGQARADKIDAAIAKARGKKGGKAIGKKPAR